MLNGKYTSIKQIISELYRDTGIQSELDWISLMEWTADALNLIGNPRQYIRKVTGHEDNPNLDITNYKAKLPCDFHRLEQIAVNGYPARYASHTFHHLLNGNCCGFDRESAQNADLFMDNFGNQFSPQSSAISGFVRNENITFDINNDFLTISEKEGKVCIAYLAIPTDDDGFPLIPDHISYREAIKSYLRMKLFFIDWMSDKIKSDKFHYAEREWMWYSAQAGSKAKDMGIDQMESFKNQLIRLIPKENRWSEFFANLGAREYKRKQ